MLNRDKHDLSQMLKKVSQEVIIQEIYGLMLDINETMKTTKSSRTGH